MRRTAFLVFAATVLSLGAVGSASSADLGRRPVYAPPPPPAPIYNWRSCYVGLNAGGVWGTMHDDWTANSGFNDPGAINAAGSANLDGAGFIGGGQVGCNWQWTPSFVWGVEADIQYTGLDESRDVVLPATITHTDENFHSDFRSRWLATFRGRFGWLVNPSVLLYGTGGLAVANIETTDSVAFADSGTNNTVSASKTRIGWTVGGGVEWMFLPQWSVKVEYLYVDLGAFDTVSGNSDPVDFPNSFIVHDHHLTENIGRVGVNFHF
jgi:outer membrane immunogenic protein